MQHGDQVRLCVQIKDFITHAKCPHQISSLWATGTSVSLNYAQNWVKTKCPPVTLIFKCLQRLRFSSTERSVSFPNIFNVLHSPRRQTLTCHVKLLICQEMLPNALCNHMKRAAGQRANCINFERVSMRVCVCVCVCGRERGGGCVCVRGGIITGWFNFWWS